MSYRKYRNKPTGGYSSRREAEAAAGLHILAKLGKIVNLREQVKYVLIPKQPGKLRNEREVTYTADFVYHDKDGEHVIDSKGFKTQQYIIRRKLMKFRFGIEVEEI